MTAHPKVDPKTGELLFFGYGPFPPYLRYTVVSADGALTRSEEIPLPVPTMMHDFIATREHVIFMVFPATLRPENLTSGSPVRWEPELGTRIGVMPRNGGSADIVWFETDPCFVFHAMNAYTQGNTVIADVCQFRLLPLFQVAEGDLETNIPVFTRWSLDLTDRSITQAQRDDRLSEFPRLDERYAGLPYRKGYAAGQEGAVPPSEGLFNTVIGYDHANGRSHTHAFGLEQLFLGTDFCPTLHAVSRRRGLSARGSVPQRGKSERSGHSRRRKYRARAAGHHSPPPPGAVRLSWQLG